LTSDFDFLVTADREPRTRSDKE